MKRFAFIVMAAAALFSACTEEGTGNGGTNTGEPLMADFTISVNPATVGEEVTFAGKAEGGSTPYTFNWELGSERGRGAASGSSRRGQLGDVVPALIKAAA